MLGLDRYWWRLLAVLGAVLALLPTPGRAEALQIPDTPPPPAQAPVRHADPLTLDSPITGPSYLTAQDVDRFLAPFPLHGYGAAFIEQEARTRVRADFMVGIVMIENTLGKSGLAQEQHNLFSIKGSGASGFEEYATWEESIRRGADYLSGNYVRAGQPLYRGGRVRDIAQVYAESGTWPQRVIDTANLIGPSTSPAYEAAVRIDSVAAGQVRFRIANRGYMPWRQAAPEHFLVHAFWTGQGRSESAVVRVEARDLTSGGSTEYDLELGSALPDAWRLVVTVELAGADWLIGLGSEATAAWLTEPTPRGTARPGISAG